MKTIEREPCPECMGAQAICQKCGGSGLSGCSLDRILSCFGYTVAAIQAPIDSHENDGHLWRTVWLNDGRVIQVGPRSAMIFAGPEQLSSGVPMSEVDDRAEHPPVDRLIHQLRRQDQLALALGRAVVDNFAEELEGDLDMNGGDVVQVIGDVYQYETQLGGDDVGRRALQERDIREGVVAYYCPTCGEGGGLGEHWEGCDAARDLRLQPFVGPCPKCGETRAALAGVMDEHERRELAIGALDAACRSIQDAVGQTDGGTAGMHFCGENEDRFVELMNDYLDAELLDLAPTEEEDLADNIEDLIEQGHVRREIVDGVPKYFSTGGPDEPIDIAEYVATVSLHTQEFMAEQERLAADRAIDRARATCEPRVICPAPDCQFCKPDGVPVPGVPFADPDRS